MVRDRGSNKDLGIELKNQIAQWLLQRHVSGRPNYGLIKEASSVFGASKATVKRIWKSAKEQVCNGEVVTFKKNRLGVTHKDKWQLDVDKVRSLSVLERSSIRKMCAKLGVSKSLLHKWIKQKLLRPHTNAIKPHLSEPNKLARLKFGLCQLICQNVEHVMKFKSMHNVVHIDEKWFYITKASCRYYLLPYEEEPYRACKSKRFITKIMFICAVERPLINSSGEVIFDGKIGIFPFTEQVPAKRNSKNRDRGTMEVKPIQSIIKSVIKNCLINEVIPAIKAMWPLGASKEILIQQDNAKPHIHGEDPEFIQAANSDGFKMKLISQPPNSPDTNVLDLGFFRAIESLQDDKPCKNVEELLDNVKLAFHEQPATKLNNVFLTLQSCFEEIMKVKGGNNYKTPHKYKECMILAGTLPECMEVETKLVKDCIEYLMLPENDVGSSYDLGHML